MQFTISDVDGDKLTVDKDAAPDDLIEVAISAAHDGADTFNVHLSPAQVRELIDALAYSTNPGRFNNNY